ncbi:MAG: 1-acyl-sn-glycerol-3-phosphate acyltransferase [Thermoanaerobaculaceae bacterium]|nr:1-acyl-sn-glycerol-3-phosphate acyltransferase [Thermoanaerobaculaceae bacterium]MDI9622216.1 1-acyl-sn-glycerol-3-phosphate acyltransferase [Acidobacteriota bacterium]NLH12591.1 1-acyl-sn-glycerol-3-phosphate acyltransferase [Holophagae bacterium]
MNEWGVLPPRTGRARWRAIGRLGWFAIASWGVVASALLAVCTRFPRRWVRTAPYIARWARLGRRCLGLEVVVLGQLPPAGSLVVANHQGWLDIPTIGGVGPCIFAARHDMRSWPLFGALASSGATIFINRHSKRAGARGIQQVGQALEAGATVIGFPEGTSSGGGMLPFRTGLFEAAVVAQVPVVPATIRYLTLDGAEIDADRLRIVGWFDGEPFLAHALQLASHRVVQATVRFGSPIPPPHADRRGLAAMAEKAVRELLEEPDRPDRRDDRPI